MVNPVFRVGQGVRIKQRGWNGQLVRTGYVGTVREFGTLPNGTPMYRVRLNDHRTIWFFEDELEEIDVQGK